LQLLQIYLLETASPIDKIRDLRDLIEINPVWLDN
jgi:hypothetical protein